MEPPHLTASPVPGAARALLASGKAGDRPSLPASGQTRPFPRQPSPLCIKTVGRDGTGFAVGCISAEHSGKSSHARAGWDGPAPNPPVGANGYFAAKKPAGLPLPPSPGNAEPGRDSRDLHALLVAFPCKISSATPRPVPSLKRAAPATAETKSRRRRPGAAGHRVWPLAPSPPLPEAGAYRGRARRRRNWAELFPARLAF